MELHALEVREYDDAARLQCQVVTGGRSETLWFEVPRRYAGQLTSDRYDGFVVALLPRAMAAGENLVVRGALSERLHFNVVHFYTSLFASLARQFRAVQVSADRLDTGAGRSRPNGAATGFSAGVDSFAALHDHFIAEQRAGYRITHLLINNVGSHGQRNPAAARELFRRRYENIRGYPESAALEFVPVDSNLDELLGLDFELTHTPRNAAVALLMQPLFGRFYYASTYRYSDIAVREYFDSGCIDPLALPLLSTETLDLVASGSQHTRVEKTRLVGLVPGASRVLNVCTNAATGGQNCSACIKCARTMLTLEVLGMLDEFGAVFDLAGWERMRDRYVSREILNRRRPGRLSRELREYLDRTGYRYTWRQHVGSLLNSLPGWLRKAGRVARRHRG